MSALIHSQVASTFDGSSEYVSMGDVLDKERTDGFSGWAWVKSSTTSDAILGKRTTDANLRGYEMGLDGTGKLIVEIQNAVGNRIEVTTDDVWGDGAYHLFAFSYDGSSTAAGCILYVDGVPVPQTANEDTLSATISNSADFTIAGRDGSTTAALAATLDEPGFADDELTQAQILELWNGGTPPDVKGMTFYTPHVRFGGGAWRAGDGDTTSVWTDVTGKNDGTVTGFAAANYVNDVPFRHYLNILSLIFDASDDHIDLGDVLGFEHDTTFSFEFWFNTAGTAGDQVFISKLNAATPFHGYQAHMDSSGSIHLKLVNDDDPAGTDVVAVKTTATGFDDSAWHHCVITYSGSKTPGGIHIYVDSTDEALTTLESDALAGTMVNTGALRFGATGGGADRFDGMMTQMVFYGAELVQGEVDELFDNGPIDKALTSVWPAIIGWWHLGGCDTGSSGALTTTHDRSVSAANDGTSAGSPVVAADVPTGGRNVFGGLALNLNGTSEYLDSGDLSAWAFTHTSEFSLECWFKAPTAVTGTDVIVSKADSATGQGYRVSMNTSEWISFELVNTNTTNEVHIRFDNPTTNDGEWHHLVVTWDGTGSQAATNATIYLDGKETTRSIVTDNLSASFAHAVSLQWGAQEGTNFFSGSLASPAVYSVALTAAEVEEHYNGSRPGNRTTYSTESALAGWWPIGNGQGSPGETTRICDYSHNSFNDSTLTGSGAGYGQFTTDGLLLSDTKSGLVALFGNRGAQARSGRAVQQSRGSYARRRGFPHIILEDGPSSGFMSQSQSRSSEARSGRAMLQSRGSYARRRGFPQHILEQDLPTLQMPPPGITNTSEGVPGGGGGGGGITSYFKMRGVDSGAGYTTWTVQDAPDPNGAEATGGNTTPALVGSIVAGSGIVADSWQQ